MDKQLLLELKVINRQLNHLRNPNFPRLSELYEKTRKELGIDED